MLQTPIPRSAGSQCSPRTRNSSRPPNTEWLVATSRAMGIGRQPGSLRLARTFAKAAKWPIDDPPPRRDTSPRPSRHPPTDHENSQVANFVRRRSPSASPLDGRQRHRPNSQVANSGERPTRPVLQRTGRKGRMCSSPWSSGQGSGGHTCRVHWTRHVSTAVDDLSFGAGRPRKRRCSGADALSGRRTPYR